MTIDCRCWCEVWLVPRWAQRCSEEGEAPQVPERWAPVHCGHRRLRDGHWQARHPDHRPLRRLAKEWEQEYVDMLYMYIHEHRKLRYDVGIILFACKSFSLTAYGRWFENGRGVLKYTFKPHLSSYAWGTLRCFSLLDGPRQPDIWTTEVQVGRVLKRPGKLFLNSTHLSLGPIDSHHGLSD